MQITVFGASGKVGQLVVRQLLEQGHTVQLFVHRSSPFEPSDRIKVIKSDIHNAAFVEAAVRGSDAVISTLGSWHTPTKDILSAAMRFVLPAMQQEGVTRIITLTGSAAVVPGEELSKAAKISHRLFGFVAKDIIRDAEEHMRLLVESTANWTVIRSPIMRSSDNTEYVLNQKMPSALERIPRAAVAQAIVDQLNTTNQIKQAPHIHAV